MMLSALLLFNCECPLLWLACWTDC